MTELELFSCGADSFGPAQVLCAAAHWGELDDLCMESRRRNEARDRAREAGTAPADDVLQGRSEDFRRARGLATARATQAWLTGWGLTLDEFTDFLEREVLAETFPVVAPRSGRKHPARDPRLREVLWADAVFTGRADSWTARLAARAAASQDVAERAGIPASIFDLGGPIDPSLIKWLEAFGLDHHWGERLRAMEAAFAHFSNSILVPQRLEGTLAAHWEALLAVELALGAFRSEAAAREALLCMEEDGMALEEICRHAGGHYQRARHRLGELPEAMRVQALAANAGDLLAIVPWDDYFMVPRVLEKIEPRLDAPDVRAWVEGRLLEEALAPLVSRHVRWPGGDHT